MIDESDANRLGQLPDLELEKYKLDRAHELELNKFAHALEVERLKILSYLNGGAIAVLLALFKEGLENVPAIGRIGIAVSVAFWIAGLYAAARATQLNLETQIEFNRAYHRRRRAIEWRLLATKYTVDALTRAVGTHSDDRTLPPDEEYDAAARAAVDVGTIKAKRVTETARASVVLFMCGAAVATISVIWLGGS
jgi:hypothetical protein